MPPLQPEPMNFQPGLSWLRNHSNRVDCLAFGLLFLLADLLKVADFGHFQAMLSRYGLIPASLLPVAAPVLVVSEFLLAVTLLRMRRPLRDLALCEALLYLFALATASVLFRGLRIRCACFGVFSTRLTLVHPSLCLLIAGYLSWRRLSRRQDYSRALQQPRPQTSRSGTRQA